MNHFNPCFDDGDGSSGLRHFCCTNVVMRKKWVGLAVAAGPVGATEPGVGQAGEGTEDNQVKGEEHRHPCQSSVAIITARHVYQGQRDGRQNQRLDRESDQHAGFHHLKQGSGPAAARRTGPTNELMRSGRLCGPAHRSTHALNERRSK